MADERRGWCNDSRYFPHRVTDWAVGILLSIYLSANFLWFGAMNHLLESSSFWWGAIGLFKTCTETLASLYALFYLAVALQYRRPQSSVPPLPLTLKPRVFVAYFCCDDFDPLALANIAEHCHRDCVQILVHDDSKSESNQEEVNRVCRAINQRYQQVVEELVVVIRRSDRSGGKAGAANNLLLHLPEDTEYLLLCDSDSYFYDERVLASALRYFDDSAVAVAQFQNIGHDADGDGRGYRLLSKATTFYDAFVAFMSRYGWTPFLGHNALLRVSTIRELGGFTPGQLADDIDYSVRLRLDGYRVVYARDVVGGERHPISYDALRRRTRKWTYGCTEIVIRWGWQVLCAAHLSLLEKLTFFLTVCYYHLQVVLLLYLFVFYAVLPFRQEGTGSVASLVVSAGLILLLTFLPSMTFFRAERQLRAWPRTVACWGLVYGSQDFVMLQAVMSRLGGRSLAWVPTNLSAGTTTLFAFAPEAIFGLLIVLIAAIKQPQLLALPTTILFAAKFLVAPFLDRWFFRPATEKNEPKCVSPEASV